MRATQTSQYRRHRPAAYTPHRQETGGIDRRHTQAAEAAYRGGIQNKMYQEPSGCCPPDLHYPAYSSCLVSWKVAPMLNRPRCDTRPAYTDKDGLTDFIVPDYGTSVLTEEISWQIDK